MKIVRTSHAGNPIWGIVEGDAVWRLDGSRFVSPQQGEYLAPIDGLHLLPPIDPSNKVVGVLGGWARRDRDGPGTFIKPSSSLIGHEGQIVWPPVAESMHYEPELAIVIGQRLRDVTPPVGKTGVMGYTIANDVTTFKMKSNDGSGFSTRFKTFDTFGPLGPWIVTGIDGDDLRVRSVLNGQPTNQDRSTSELAWSVGEVVSWVSSIMTLEPGDIISTGTPPGFGPMAVGDTIECVIEGIGVLRNTVVSEVG